MPDYRRLVSYMYNYENGMKKNNVGYARVEARNGQCKVTLHIAAPSLNEKQLKAYIFKRRKAGLEGVLLGVVQVRNGIGEYKLITDSEHVMNSNYSLLDMGGIVIHYTDNKFFATQWDDISISKRDITTLENYPMEYEKELNEQRVGVAAIHTDELGSETTDDLEAADITVKKLKIVNHDVNQGDLKQQEDKTTAEDLPEEAEKIVAETEETVEGDHTETNEVVEGDVEKDDEKVIGASIHTKESSLDDNNTIEENTTTDNELGEKDVLKQNEADKEDNTQDEVEMEELYDKKKTVKEDEVKQSAIKIKIDKENCLDNLSENEMVNSQPNNKVDEVAAVPDEDNNNIDQKQEQSVLDIVNNHAHSEDQVAEDKISDEKIAKEKMTNVTMRDERTAYEKLASKHFAKGNIYQANIKKDNHTHNNISKADVKQAEQQTPKNAPIEELEKVQKEDSEYKENSTDNQRKLENNTETEKELKSQGHSASQSFFEDHPIAMKIYRSFPRMYPFEDNEVAWCARIEPQDIGLFPMEDWVLANNSFLLHGYYSYRHLIFARMNDKSSPSYILGVPGIYHNREKFMAKMFGFENFKCVKRKERKTGEFGYWYLPIVLN